MGNQGILQFQKQSAILKAAQRRFAQYGHSKVTMDEIAADVGMGKASLYYYYPTKEELFRAVVEHEQAEFLSLMEPVLREEISSGAKLRTYIERRMEYFRNFVNLASLGTSVVVHADPVIAEMFRVLTMHDYRMIETILAEGVARKEFGAIDVNTTASLIVHLLQGLRLRLLKKFDVQEQEEAYTELRRDQELLSTLLVRGLHADSHGSHSYDGSITHESATRNEEGSIGNDRHRQ